MGALMQKSTRCAFQSTTSYRYFIADFYCHSHRLVIEIDGKIHVSQKDYDEGRTAELERFDLTVIRFTNDEVLNDIDGVVEKIRKYLKQNPPQTPKGA